MGPDDDAPGVEKNDTAAGVSWPELGWGVLETWLTSPGDSASDMMIWSYTTGL